MEKRQEYFRLRALGFTASVAWRCANTNVLFAQLEKQGAVRLEEVPDEPHVPDYVDTWGLSSGRTERLKREIREQAEREGTWAIMAYVRCECCGQWTLVDSVGDFVGDGWRDSGYDEDLRSAAIEAWHKGIET